MLTTMGAAFGCSRLRLGLTFVVVNDRLQYRTCGAILGGVYFWDGFTAFCPNPDDPQTSGEVLCGSHPTLGVGNLSS